MKITLIISKLYITSTKSPKASTHAIFTPVFDVRMG